MAKKGVYYNGKIGYLVSRCCKGVALEYANGLHSIYTGSMQYAYWYVMRIDNEREDNTLDIIFADNGTPKRSFYLTTQHPLNRVLRKYASDEVEYVR